MFLTSIILLLFSTEFISSDTIIPNELRKISLDGHYNLNFVNNEPSTLIIEIFSPTKFLNIFCSSATFVNVLQASIFLPMLGSETILIQNNGGWSIFWYRVINTRNVVPRNFPLAQNFQMNVTMKDYWYTSIEFLPAQISSLDWMVPMHYNLWIFPIFPKGQLTSWGAEFSNLNESLIMSQIDSSLDSSILKKSGFVITTLNNQPASSQMQLTIANRRTYTNLIIIEAVFNASFSMQYPPVIIYGCAFDGVLSSLDSGTTRWFPEPSCYLINVGGWRIFLMCIVGFIFLFTIIGCCFENVLSLAFSWLVLSYVFCIGFHYTFRDINEAGNSLYYIIGAICPGIAVLMAIFNCYCCSTKSRARIIFNVLCIILILYHVLWFIFQNFVSDFRIVLGVISGVLIILFFLLFYFYEITITLGNVFICMSIALCGISLVGINSSSFPYLFLDFFNYILYRDNSVHYYKYFLLDDVLLFVSLGLSVTLFGYFSYSIYKGSKKEDEPDSSSSSNLISPVGLARESVTIYGAMSTQQFTNNLGPEITYIESRTCTIQATAPAFHDTGYKY